MGPVKAWDLITRPFRSDVRTVGDGEKIVVDARGHWRLCVMAGTGATVVIHRVDAFKGDAAWGTPDTGTERDVTAPAAGAASAIDVDWPFYQITSSGGSAYVSLI